MHLYVIRGSFIRENAFNFQSVDEQLALVFPKSDKINQNTKPY